MKRVLIFAFSLILLASLLCGQNEVVFTTKHHDGFSMFDSRYTDYKITAPDCPCHTNPKANITKEVFDTFRKEGFLVGGRGFTSSRAAGPAASLAATVVGGKTRARAAPAPRWSRRTRKAPPRSPSGSRAG